MGFFDRIFGSNVQQDSIWNYLSSIEEVDSLLMASNVSPQVVLKHSHTCGTSYFAKRNLDSIPTEQIEGADFYLIDVVRNRTVSLHLAEKVGIRHESPQLFVIKNGEILWHGSHYMVTPENLIQALG